MARPAYITEEFYKEVQFELEKYTNDYNAIMERTRILDDLQQKNNRRAEESYCLLENFGAM